MNIGGKKVSLLLFAGDLAIFAFSLWLTLLVRYGAWPSQELISTYVLPFGVLFFVWLLVFFIAGLYERRAAFFRRRLPDLIVRTQLLNIVLAALFFFFVPEFGITPKTNLFIYLVISLLLIFAWRLSVFPLFGRRQTRQSIIVIGSGSEVDELVAEVNGNPHYGLECRLLINPEGLTPEMLEQKLGASKMTGTQTLVVDTAHDATRPLLPAIYHQAFVYDTYQFAEFSAVYEEVFARVPLSLLRYEWFLKNISRPTSRFYAVLKRVLDIGGGVVMGLFTVILTPFVWVAVLIEDGGPLFIRQERLGQYGTRMKAYKFRSMQEHEAASGNWTTEGKNRVTKVGAFLRKTSLDEFPQFVNVLSGELSLIGPRNDIEGLGKRLAEEISYYDVRYIAKPGITGWAQINQRYEQGHISPQSIEETKIRLAYDFFYIKNRSFGLDIVIALRTIKRMLFRLSSR